jgi:hypothetical protein
MTKFARVRLKIRNKSLALSLKWNRLQLRSLFFNLQMFLCRLPKVKESDLDSI